MPQSLQVTLFSFFFTFSTFFSIKSSKWLFTNHTYQLLTASVYSLSLKLLRIIWNPQILRKRRNHNRKLRKNLVESFFNFIYSPLSVLWHGPKGNNSQSLWKGNLMAIQRFIFIIWLPTTRTRLPRPGHFRNHTPCKNSYIIPYWWKFFSLKGEKIIAPLD